ncbi:hypothetical protein E5288_WYG009067 [Bos mutus]|uniref:Uncharacterized protein n=1 Tax=Bos mutus TaxID=72004 RepID=A0A6B0QWP1_9CETA|nr:hypothetical protein [Bos mutus]
MGMSGHVGDMSGIEERATPLPHPEAEVSSLTQRATKMEVQLMEVAWGGGWGRQEPGGGISWGLHTEPRAEIGLCGQEAFGESEAGVPQDPVTV